MQKHILHQSPDAIGFQDEPALSFLLSSQGFATGYVSTASPPFFFFLAGQKGPKAGGQEAGVLLLASQYREGWTRSSSGWAA